MYICAFRAKLIVRFLLKIALPFTKSLFKLERGTQKLGTGPVEGVEYELNDSEQMMELQYV